MASSSRYSQLPANSRLATTTAGAALSAPPEARHHHRVALLEVGGFAEHQRLYLERRDRLQQAESPVWWS